MIDIAKKFLSAFDEKEKSFCKDSGSYAIKDSVSDMFIDKLTEDERKRDDVFLLYRLANLSEADAIDFCEHITGERGGNQDKFTLTTLKK